MNTKHANTTNRLPEPGERSFTGTDATDEVTELLNTARSNPKIAAAIDAKRSELEATLAELRKLRGFNQTELAEIMGVTQPSISNLENSNLGRVHFESLKDIGDAMGFETIVVFEDRENGDRFVLRSED